MAAMSKEHKEALARGRAQSRAVKAYLQARESASRRGPKMTPEKLRDRIEATSRSIEEEDDPVRRLELVQQRLDDTKRLEEAEKEVDIDTLESAFIDVAAEYGDRKGISYAAWREVGVPAAVLKSAGIKRSA